MPLICFVHPYAIDGDPDRFADNLPNWRRVERDTLTSAILSTFRADGYKPFCDRCGVELGYRATASSMHLVCPPKSKPRHLTGCPFYQPQVTPLRMGPGANFADIRIKGGFLHANLSDPLRQGPAAPREIVDRVREPAPRKSRGHSSRVTPLGFLQFGVEAIGLTRHDPANPASTDWHPHAVKLEALLERVASRQGPLGDFSIVPHRLNQSGFRAKLDAIRQAPESVEQNYLRIFGELNHIDLACDGQDGLVGIRHLGDLVSGRKRMLRRALDNAKGLAAGAMRLMQGDSRLRILLVGRLEHRTDGTLRLVSVSFQMTSQRWVPVHSGLELDAVNWCVDNGVNFHKPARPLEGMGVFPDLIIYLLDGRVLFWEIAGMDTPDYLEHLRDVKLPYYRKHHPQCFGLWNAYAGRPMPDFRTLEGACTTLWGEGR